MEKYFYVVNQNGERRSPHTFDQSLAEVWAKTSRPYFDGEVFEVCLDEEVHPGVDDEGRYMS